ncbi:MAG: hypothetical protein IPM32_02765 [Ignavibacteriae bacterium]|nr:hypothetical protein [Ignavibacteriota bacterium]
MKIQKLKKFLFYGFITFISISINAQEMVKDQLFLIHEEIAKVEKFDQYEESSKEWLKFMTEVGLDIPQIHVSQRDDFHYYYLIPIANYAEIDKIHDKFMSAYEKIDKQKASDFETKNSESIETYKQFVANWSADLSYIPKTPHVKQDEGKFMHWMFFNYRLGKQKEVKSILKEWKQLYEKNNLSFAYDVWTIDMGENANMIVINELYKDGADYYNSMKEISSKIKADEEKLWAKFAPLILNIENKYGSLRPDLSYTKK